LVVYPLSAFSLVLLILLVRFFSFSLKINDILNYCPECGKRLRWQKDNGKRTKKCVCCNAVISYQELEKEIYKIPIL
jgi:hypothetical protein